MNALHLTVAAPGDDPAVLTVPQPLTAERLTRLERAIASTLGMLRRDLCGRASDAGDIGYASWLAALRSSRP
jgi:hypothetical protein